MLQLDPGESPDSFPWSFQLSTEGPPGSSHCTRPLVLQEAPRRGQEVPEGVRDGEPRHVVHRLPLEEGLPEVRGLRAQPVPSRRRPPAAHVEGAAPSSDTCLRPRESTSGSLGGITAQKTKNDHILLLRESSLRAARMVFFPFKRKVNFVC